MKIIKFISLLFMLMSGVNAQYADNFSGDSTQTLHTYNGNWDHAYGDNGYMKIYQYKIRMDAWGENETKYHALSTSDTSTITVLRYAPGTICGPAVRVSGTQRGYEAHFNVNSQRANGSVTRNGAYLAGFDNTGADSSHNYVLSIRIKQPDTVEVYIDGSRVAAIHDPDDLLPEGHPGFYANNGGTANYIMDNWNDGRVKPTITSITGTIADGQSVTIRGKWFGTKTQPKPLVWADFSTDVNPSSLGVRTTWDENQNLVRNTSIPTGSGTTNGVTGTWSTSPARVSFSFGVLVSDPNYYNRVYTFGKRYFDFPTTSNQKVWRINPDPDCGLGDGCGDPVMNYNSAVGFAHLNECDSDNPNRLNNNNSYETYTEDQWCTEEVKWQFTGGDGTYMNGTVAPATGIFQHWRNGTEIFNMQSVNNCTNRYSNLRLFDNYTPDNIPTDTPTNGSKVHMTYLYADTVYNRIIMTDTSGTKRMVVIPTAWSDTSVTGTVYQADFNIGEPVRLYVYNGLDSVSTAYSSTMSSSGGATPATISVQPVSDTVVAGQAAMFFVTATGTDLTYQWYRNDSLVAGATNDTFAYTTRALSAYKDNIYCRLTTDTSINSNTIFNFVVQPKEKILVVGDSKMSGYQIDTAVSYMESGSRYSYRAASGYGWNNYDYENDVTHWVENYISADTATVVLIELGINNIWGTANPGSVYYTQIDDIKVLDRWWRITKTLGKKMVLLEISSQWWTGTSDTANARILVEIKQRNLKRKEWCAYNGVAWVPLFDSLCLPNQHPNPFYYNADLLHYSFDAHGVIGRQIARYINTVPAKTESYTVKKVASKNITTYSSTNAQHHLINLSKIKDTTFWASCKPDGSNLALFINGVKTNRLLRDFASSANRGALEYVYTGAITTLELKTGNYNERDTISFTGSNLNRYYRLNDKLSLPTSIIDTVNGYNVSSPGSVLGTYTYDTSYHIYNDSTYKKTLRGNTTNIGAVNTGLSGLTKFTVQEDFQIYGDVFWTGSGILFSLGSNTIYLMLNTAGGFAFQIGAGLWTIPASTVKPYLTNNKFHTITIMADLTQSTPANKVKLVIDSTEITGATVSGTIPTALPTLTQNYLISGYYSGSAFWPVATTIKDVKVYTTNLTPAEAIAEYKLQNSSFTVTTVQSTTGSRRSGNKQSNMGMGMH